MLRVAGARSSRRMSDHSIQAPRATRWGQCAAGSANSCGPDVTPRVRHLHFGDILSMPQNEALQILDEAEREIREIYERKLDADLA